MHLPRFTSRHFIPLFVAALLIGLAVGCRPSSEHAYTHLAGKAQGTTFSIKYADPAGRDFSASVDSMFRLLDKSMSLWDSTSLISRINRQETDSLGDAHFRTVLDAALGIAKATGGAFDPTVGPLIRAWGFSARNNLPEPDSAMIDSLRGLTGFSTVRIEGDRLVRDHAGTEIDLNAIAQGYTVDLIAGFLRDKGIRDLMVEVGGEVYASGVNDQGKPWQIGIDKPVEDPEAEHREIQVAVPLSDQALATSGSYRKFKEKGGKHVSHIIDPRTGYPVPHRLVSVSVIASDAMTADAWATAIMVLGLDEGIALADSAGMEVFGILLEPDGRLTTRFTKGFPQ